MLNEMKFRILSGKTLFFIFALLVVSVSLYSTIINVPGDQPTIQEGINVSVDGDTILVQPDTYFENINYNGKNITVASLFLTTQDTTYISQTIIDGNQDGSVVTFESGEDSTAVLCGFTITNGHSEVGGGIYCDSSPCLQNLIITGNSADFGGGGIVCIDNAPIINNNIITGNNAEIRGAGIYIWDCPSIIITNNDITGNIVTEGFGGGLFGFGSEATIEGNTITDNWSAWGGGGIFLTNWCSATITDNFLTANTAEAGGGIVVYYECSATLIGNFITDNTALSGGGIACAQSTLTLIDVTISNNEADSLGGGVYCEDDCNLNLENVTVSQNTAGEDGGGIYSKYSDLQIENCDFTNNTSQGGYGGAIDYWNNGDPQYAGETYQVVITNTCFSNNTASGDGGVCIGKTNDDLTIINVAIEDCEFVDNIANSYGGLYLRGDMLTFSVLNSIFTDNEAISYVAGCCFTHYCTGEMINCLFASNAAATGGGYCNSGGVSVWTGTNVDLVNCTFADNSAAYGAGLTVGSGGTATITDCVFWDNSYNQIALVDYNDQGGTLFVDYCDVQDGIDSVSVSSLSTLNWGTGNINEDPLFVGTGDYPFSIQDLSPCVNAGIPDTTGLNLPEFDLAGNPRVYGGRIDMGAYENQNVGGTDEDLIPLVTRLSQNYPNPFKPSGAGRSPATIISFSVAQTLSFVTLDIYNIKGQKVKTLVNEVLPAGEHSIVWDGKDNNNKPVSSGIYFYKMKTDNFEKTRKMILMK